MPIYKIKSTFLRRAAIVLFIVFSPLILLGVAIEAAVLAVAEEIVLMRDAVTSSWRRC